eukprot:4525030-Prymnesium_polylepis.1
MNGQMVAAVGPRWYVVGLDCGFGQVSNGDLALSPWALKKVQHSLAGLSPVRVSGWGPLHAVHLHG